MLAPFRYRSNLFVLATLGLFYYLLQVYIFNIALINQTLVGSYELPYKLSLLSNLVINHHLVFPLFQALFLVGSSLLVGTNLMLLILRIQKARSYGGLKTNIGGTSILAVVGSGCSSCGIGVFSLLGPGSSVASFLLRNWIIQFGIIGLLSIGIIVSLQALRKNVCGINAGVMKLRDRQ